MQEKGGPVKIGITGGIGAGKSIVCKIFMSFNIPVYNADERARYLMNNDPRLISLIKKRFSEKAYVNGKVDSTFLSTMVFNDDSQLKSLNEMVHPAVFSDFETWLHQHRKYEIIIKEAALLFESGSYAELDKVILVYCPLETRINRIIMRDPHRSRRDIEKIIERQMPDPEKKKMADFLITNDDLNPVIPQVLDILEKIKNLPGSSTI